MRNNILIALLFAFALTLSAAEPVTFVVTVNAGKYYIDGGLTPDLILNPGVTYQFVQSDASNSTHPLQLSATMDGTHAGGDQYLTGYSYQGTAGADGVAIFTVPSESPSILYYYCQNHSGFANTSSITIVVPLDNLPNQIVWEKDGAQMALIPVGSFEMGDHFGEGRPEELPVHRVTLDAFYMDVHEVTVDQFREFVNQSGYTYQGDWNDVAKYSPGDNYPMTYVNWHDAVAYAKWVGKRLPTEAEWEYAARGGLVGKRYPWGNEITHDDANWGNTVNGKDKWKYCSPVGSFEANGYGLYDMAGNAWEWCQDWYDSDYYSKSSAKNPPGPDTGFYRVFRGGDWGSGDGMGNVWRVSYRGFDHPPFTDSYTYWWFDYGFRCVSGLNFTSGSFTTLLPSDDQTGSNWFADLSLSATDFTWTSVDSSSATFTVRLLVQPLGGIDASAWDFSAISMVDALTDQLGSGGLNLVEGTDYQLLVVGQDDQGTVGDANDDVVETLEILLGQLTQSNQILWSIPFMVQSSQSELDVVNLIAGVSSEASDGYDEDLERE